MIYEMMWQELKFLLSDEVVEQRLSVTPEFDEEIKSVLRSFFAIGPEIMKEMERSGHRGSDSKFIEFELMWPDLKERIKELKNDPLKKENPLADQLGDKVFNTILIDMKTIENTAYIDALSFIEKKNNSKLEG